MDKQFDEPDIQVLFDLLARETQLYTRAFTSGAQDDMARHRVVIDALIAEIKRRKNDSTPLPEVVSKLPPDDFFDATP